MTEKEFWNEVWERAGQGAHGQLLANFAVKAANEAGAKFDPEPVELPRIFVADDDLPTPALGFSVGNPGKGFAVRRLSSAQLAEVVRRCNAWDEMRRLAVDGQYYGIEKILGVKR